MLDDELEIEDIDNIDLEEQMYQMDVEEEESAEEDVEEELNLDYRHLLTRQNLELDLSCNECDRVSYTFRKSKETYTGKVLFKMNNDTFIFSVLDKDSETGRKTKKFYLSEIHQIK